MARLPRGEALDRLVAAGLLVLAQIELWIGRATPGPKPLTVPLALATTAAVAVRRRNPLLVGGAILAATSARILVGGAGYSVALAVAWMCALYAIAVWTDRRAFLAGLGLLAALNALDQLRPDQRVQDGVLFTVIPAIAMVLLRSAVRGRQLQADALAARAALLEREQELRAREAIAEERARIARELHDLVAHNVSVMVVQAGAERHGLGPEHASTREALAAIEQAGRQALAEARRLLGMLRADGGAPGLEPQPSLAQIDVLIDQVRRAGLSVRYEVEGRPAALPAGVDLCAYRIVQEGLTNALKHAGTANAEVLLRYAPRALDVEIRDDGAGADGAAANGAGHGLVGMRERVTLYGGRLEAGPRAEGGFRVRAQLPLG